MGHWWFCNGPQNYSKNRLLGLKKSYFSYIYWRIDKNWGLQCADLFFRDQGQKCSSKAEDPFFSEIWTKNRSPRGEDLCFLISGQSLSKQRWVKSGDLFLFWGSVPQSYCPTQWSAGQWAMQTFKKHKMGHGYEKVENHCLRLLIKGLIVPIRLCILSATYY